MTEDSNAFIKKLDELIALFETLKKKATKEGIIIENDPLYKNFEMLSNNYRLIKHNLPMELLEEIGEPIMDLLSQMIAQLKQEIGETQEYNKETKSDLSNELEEIDKLLKSNNLSEEEINKLLDKRSKLI